MKKSRVISLVLSLCLLAAAVPALADEVPQPVRRHIAEITNAKLFSVLTSAS